MAFLEDDKDYETVNPLIPTLIFFLIAYNVASFYINIFDFSYKTVLYCVIIEYKLNHSRKVKELTHCPEPLKELL